METSVHPETTVSFKRREREQTCGIELCFPVEVPPTSLTAALAEIGFVEDGLRMPPPLNGVEKIWLHKRGTALFGAWTAEEKKANMAAARKVLRRFGFERVPVNVLTYFDLV